MANSFFITGTDTGIGKTLIAAGLLHAAKTKGMSTLGQTGQAVTRRGNTAERVIAALTQDVMVVNH